MRYQASLGFMSSCLTLTEERERLIKQRVMTVFAVAALMLAFTPTSPAFEQHPQIRAAMQALSDARDHLEHAAHDFGGHRVDAIHAIDEAHHQLKICMDYDK